MNLLPGHHKMASRVLPAAPSLIAGAIAKLDFFGVGFS